MGDRGLPETLTSMGKQTQERNPPRMQATPGSSAINKQEAGARHRPELGGRQGTGATGPATDSDPDASRVGPACNRTRRITRGRGRAVKRNNRSKMVNPGHMLQDIKKENTAGPGGGCS